jgi:hypothetical protein
MKTITAEELLEFAKSQDQSRVVDMSQNSSYSPCGCLMVHYGKEKLKLTKPFVCGDNFFNSYSQEFRIENGIQLILGCSFAEAFTYGEIVSRIEEYISKKKLASL